MSLIFLNYICGSLGTLVWSFSSLGGDISDIRIYSWKTSYPYPCIGTKIWLLSSKGSLNMHTKGGQASGGEISLWAIACISWAPIELTCLATYHPINLCVPSSYPWSRLWVLLVRTWPLDFIIYSESGTSESSISSNIAWCFHISHYWDTQQFRLWWYDLSMDASTLKSHHQNLNCWMSQ